MVIKNTFMTETERVEAITHINSNKQAEKLFAHYMNLVTEYAAKNKTGNK